eukprot:COSAG02_NODE_2364_length_9055_cov_12.230606_6_plen_46_part_00
MYSILKDVERLDLCLSGFLVFNTFRRTVHVHIRPIKCEGAEIDLE